MARHVDRHRIHSHRVADCALRVGSADALGKRAIGRHGAGWNPAELAQRAPLEIARDKAQIDAMGERRAVSFEMTPYLVSDFLRRIAVLDQVEPGPQRAQFRVEVSAVDEPDSDDSALAQSDEQRSDRRFDPADSCPRTRYAFERPFKPPAAFGKRGVERICVLGIADSQLFQFFFEVHRRYRNDLSFFSAW